MSAKVYFSRTITPEKVLELYRMAGKELSGKVAVKVHSGEKGNHRNAMYAPATAVIQPMPKYVPAASMT